VVSAILVQLPGTIFHLKNVLFYCAYQWLLYGAPRRFVEWCLTNLMLNLDFVHDIFPITCSQLDDQGRIRYAHTLELLSYIFSVCCRESSLSSQNALKYALYALLLSTVSGWAFPRSGPSICDFSAISVSLPSATENLYIFMISFPNTILD